jgi:hypothetical protein
MHGNAVRTCLYYARCELTGIWMLRLTSIANQCDFVEIDAELRHGVMRLMDKIVMGLTGTS